MRFIDLSSKRYGRLVVLRRVIPSERKGRPDFLCQCDCGEMKVYSGDALRRGDAKSCGCGWRSQEGEASSNILFTAMKNRSKRSGVGWFLGKEFFKTITKSNCHYCGVPPCNCYRSKNCNGGYIYSGIDRVDNNVGYVESNCVPCCYVCNRAKSNLPVNDFKDWAKNVYLRWASV